MGHELIADETSLTSAARRMRESADLLGRHADTLTAVVAGGGRSPWGSGLLATLMDQVNATLGEACSHLHAELGAVGAGIQDMADRQRLAEDLGRAGVATASRG